MSMQMTVPKPLPSPIDDTYKDVENLVYHICHVFQSKHGGDFDDLLSIAHQVFMDAFNCWTPGLAPFTSYLSTCIYRRLLLEKRQNSRIPTISLDKTETSIGWDPVDKSRSFSIKDFTEELSDDAKLIISLVLETPTELAKIINDKGGHPKNVRSTIRQYLTKLNWTYNRISESFDEIKKVLS